ncbi:MAG: response regulator [Myxococcaceae bacterium]|nr:response regulator [Myxococcaceae bacterium]MCI0668964.1 response regulator [Myxococcaceae bacterium]
MSVSEPKVTIVDDDRESRELLSLALSLEGLTVLTAANGLRLISLLKVDRPDVILMDVNMSWIDGFELCRAVKHNEEFRDIPVIFVSGRTSVDDRRRGIECGAVAYFTKPVDAAALAAQIRSLLAPPAA